MTYTIMDVDIVGGSAQLGDTIGITQETNYTFEFNTEIGEQDYKYRALGAKNYIGTKDLVLTYLIAGAPIFVVLNIKC